MTDWANARRIWEKNNKPSSRKLQMILGVLGETVDSGTIRQYMRQWQEEEYEASKAQFKGADNEKRNMVNILNNIV